MIRNHIFQLILACSIVALFACSDKTDDQSVADKTAGQGDSVKNTPLADKNAKIDSSGAVEIKWEDLVPKGFNPEEILKSYNIDNLPDTDPRAIAAYNAIQAAMDNAPVVADLNGKTIKLPGYMVPLDTDTKQASTFLLVPYFGACIHVPPPPLNQTVFVNAEKSYTKLAPMFDAVWVTGEIHTERTSSSLAEAGYTIKASKVEAYQE